jgi:hypothetical protein
MINALDARDLTGEENELEQKTGAFNSVNGFGKMYNRFDNQESMEYRAHLIETYGVGNFETNLDTIVLKYAFENLRENYFNKILPVIDSSINTLKFYGWETGRTAEVEKALEEFDNQIKLSIFNISPVKGKEYEQALALVRAAQRVTSLMVLAFRPITAIKELVVGTIKNTSFSWSKVYGDDSFGASDLTEAYKLFFSKDDYSLIWELNDNYRIANRDMNQLVDKTKVDRHGLNFMSSFMYWSNTAPDYINRMALFLAKMTKDGCYNAHSLDSEGNLIYDPTKDDRYSYYLSKRESYDYKIHPSDQKYNDQRSMYLTKINMFNSEMLLGSEKPLTEKDLLPMAYTTAEKESIKTFTELAYGYYDHERSPLIKHLPMGIVFGQFMTFWPAKVKYYFGPRSNNTKRGHFEQRFEMVNGKKVKKFLKAQINPTNGQEEEIEVLETELLDTDPRVASNEWVGDFHEGLMYSLGLTLRAMANPKESLSDLDARTINQAKLMTHDLLLALIWILLGILLFSDSNDVGKKTTNWQDMSQYEKLATNVILRSTKEFNPFTLLGDLQSTPSFITKMSDVKKDFVKTFEGDGDVQKFFTNTFKFLELVPNPGIR